MRVRNDGATANHGGVHGEGSVVSTRASARVWLYGVVVFAGAWLVFWIQPLAVRGVLPVLGGSPAVWNTAMVFFQSALLGGYALAHLLIRRASPAGQLAVLAALWVGVALTVPVGGLRLLGDTSADLPPVLWLLGTLAGSLGLAFVAASSLTPLVQAWLARTGTGAASVNPYFLYSVSNAGSAGALLAYPFLLEPFIGLDRQAWLWSGALLGLAPFLIVLWLALPRGRTPVSATASSLPVAALPWARILALSAVPTALLLALTRYLATDVASVPLLWIVPLALYLGTFVHAFARREMIPHAILTSLVPRALIFLAVVYPLSRTFLVLGAIVHLLVFILAALYCHGALARLRPPATDLTRFYLLVSTGGLIGGFLVALAAPLVFVDVYEHPIALALVAALLPAAPFGLGRVRFLVATVALGFVVAGLSVVHIGFGGFDERLPLLIGGAFVLVLICAPALIFLRARPALLACALLAVFLVPTAISRGREVHVAGARTFFGVYRIVEAGGVRRFYHGTTLHGAEWRRADGSIDSRITYYGIGTPYSDLLSALARRPSPVVIGIAGLGTGSLACYARPGDEVRIYEIDPVVVRLARTHFAALRNCAPHATVAVGDARLLLDREQGTLDFLALDAFASDAIPVHLLTLEAFRIYLRVLARDGVLAVHITNRYLDLEPVVAAVAERLGLFARVKRYSAPKDMPVPLASTSSSVVVLTRDEGTFRALDLDAGWVPLGSPDRVRVWTDDYTSIVPLLRWW